ncbi:hypothetical protein WSK_1966 [Novosphingobium sp. Rr 2-17]|nr:hypothetical protein WSK_1966 [Novosphingobium sp. Rr 2-17]
MRGLDHNSLGILRRPGFQMNVSPLSAYLRNVGNNRYKVNTGINNGFSGTFHAITERYVPRTYGIVLMRKALIKPCFQIPGVHGPIV